MRSADNKTATEPRAAGPVCGDRGAYAAGRKSDYGNKRATPKESLWERQSYREMAKGAADSRLEAGTGENPPYGILEGAEEPEWTV